MEGRRVLRSLTLKNILSFGPEGQTLDFEPLNVLIGPNGSGKSNLLEIIGLLKSLPRDLAVPIRDGGGIRDWLWKGDDVFPAEIESVWDYIERELPLTHRLALEADGERHRILYELIEQGNSEDKNYRYHYKYLKSGPSVYGGPDIFDHVDGAKVAMAQTGFRVDNSIFTQRKDSQRYPGLAFLERRFSEILLYRGWFFGPDSPLRMTQKADLPSDFLLEDGTNLGLVLNNLIFDGRAARTIDEHLRKIYEGADAVRIKVVGGYVEFNIQEDGMRFIPAHRLSDGTLRFLCLLAILCHPDPPPLICIEEPELGLHPDLISTIAKLLIDASQRTQLIVTTHSSDLVSALGDVPEVVVVCERGLDGTTLERLDPKRMQKWLEKYSLGHLWGMGEIGGNRW
jgi:predicted ATPase